MIDDPRAWTLIRAAARLAEREPWPARAVGLAVTREGEHWTNPNDPAVELIIDGAGGWRVRGEATAAAADLFDLFLSLCPLPAERGLCIGHLGQSLDGRIATEGGSSHYITGAFNLDHLHRLRALCDAVVVGAETVATDDPQLTTRRVTGDNATRVVLDPKRRLDTGRHLFTDSTADTLLVTQPDRARPGERHGRAEVVSVARGQAGLDPHAVATMLYRRGCRRILVEGGGTTVSNFLSANALDRLQVAIAPVILGSGRPAITLPAIEDLDAALRPPMRTFEMGDDLLFDCWLGETTL